MCEYYGNIQRIVDFYDNQHNRNMDFFTPGRDCLTKQNISCAASYGIIRAWCDDAIANHAINSQFCTLLAHIVYGWMPTMLTLYFDPETEQGLNQQANNIANALNTGVFLWPDIDNQPNDFNQNLMNLSHFLNNSYVGAAKFLHFLYPDQYAILDSRIMIALTFHGNLDQNARVPRNGRNTVSYPAIGYNVFLNYQISIRRYQANLHPEMRLRDIELKLYTVGQWLCRTQENHQ